MIKLAKCEFPYAIDTLQLNMPEGDFGGDFIEVGSSFESLPMRGELVGSESIGDDNWGVVTLIEKIGAYFFIHMSNNCNDIVCFPEKYCEVTSCKEVEK